MSTLIDELLKSIPEDSLLGDCNQPWLPGLLEAINQVLVDTESTFMPLSNASSGAELRVTLGSLTATAQVSILNDKIVSYGRQRRRRVDAERDQELHMAMMNKKLKYNLIRYAGMSFITLGILFVLVLLVISWKNNAAPDATVGTGIFNTVVEIMKLIFNVT